ncbi:diaminobutyrate acetyltransferase [Hydrogenophaga sp.]|uniref:diaminobutyrate acetyltransferase n=1 Tax=Hydrogenophaga sp. TaxID=1904254 RepID=UPI003565343F
MTLSQRTTYTPHTPPAGFRFRSTSAADGAALWRLVQASGTLELNSAYFYLLLATDFGRTCLVAENDTGVVGAVIGYHPPEQAHTAFVWQVAVHPDCRGQGLGPVLLHQWLDLPANRTCTWVTATVEDNNAPSQALFRRFARERGAPLQTQPLFTPDLFPQDHPAEPLLRIGPIERLPP